jgi:two-component system, chemotaxis family, chemotaxis protein CheY
MGGPCVLIIDDDPDTCDAIGALLRFRGYSVITTLGGLEALSLLRGGRCHPWLIILDLRMPGMSGEAFKMELDSEDRWSAVPIIVLSGDAEAAATATRMQALDFLRKPFELHELLSAVQRANGTAVRTS